MTDKKASVRCETCGWLGKRRFLRGGEGSSFDKDGYRFGPCPQGHNTLTRVRTLEQRRMLKARADLKDYGLYKT